MPVFRDIEFALAATAQPIAEEDVRAAEAALACSFPLDYRDFVLQFGAGEFDGLPLRLFAPADLVRGTPRDRARLRECWFWTDSPEVWSQQKACESIACFDSTDGHDIRFHPSEPAALYVLPHEESWIRRVEGFAGLVAFFHDYYSGTLEQAVFHPWPNHAPQ